MGKLHLGTTLWSWRESGSAKTLCTQAEQAEALGFDSIWLPENHFSGKGAIPSPLTQLAALAARTERLQLGCTSYLLPIRHPLQAAEEVAVLDQLCEGRLILGLGRGLGKPMFEAFGVSASNKRALFKRNLEIMRRAWGGEPITAHDSGVSQNTEADNAAFAQDGIVLSPLPWQQPGPPLWVAAFGPLALEQVASLGLPYLASPLESQKTLQYNYARYHQQVAEAHLPAVNTIPIMRTVHVTQSGAQTRALRRALEGTVPDQMRDRAGAVEEWAIVGEPQWVADCIAGYQENLSVTHLIVRAGIRGVDSKEQLRSHEVLRSLFPVSSSTGGP
ncbi:MAG: LLM class flavin-dependent oxidoreductase [Halioglobus sp.]